MEELLHQRCEIKLNLKFWEELHAKESFEAASRLALEEQTHLAEFEQLDYQGVNKRKAKESFERLLGEAQQIKEHKRILVTGGINAEPNANWMKENKAFWACKRTSEAIPAPSAYQARPIDHTTCPMTGKKLRIKDLIPVTFTKTARELGILPSGKPGVKYIDAITKDLLTNRSRLVCLRPTGDVMLHATYKRLVERIGTHNGYTYDYVLVW